jgi:hypothetical protein
MKIEFSRSGGFAGPAMRQDLEIDTNDLPPHEAKELLDLIDKADIKNASDSPKAPRPDALHYRIKMREGETSHTAIASDTDMPEALNPLIDWLTERASRKS